MTTEELVKMLVNHRTLGKAPLDELTWVAEHGVLSQIQPGVVVGKQGEVIDSLFIVFFGRLSTYMNLGTGMRKVSEWTGGDVTGLLPFSRLTVSNGETVVDELTEVLSLSRNDLPALTRNCYEVTAIMVHAMTDRARRFTSTALRDEKLISLGKLASGLAHELNNPASAAIRGAKSLADSLNAAEEAARDVAAAGLTSAELNELDEVRVLLATSPRALLSGLALSDREETISNWLVDHGIHRVSPEDLARTTITIEVLNTLARALRGESLSAGLRWIAGGASARSLAYDIDRAATRIHALVNSVKGFTHMDRAPVTEPIDIHRGLDDTIALLEGKAEENSVAITLTVPPDIPAVHGVGVELNQVWMNLIDNALDAAPHQGRVEVTSKQQGTCVLVRVVDDGPGIPPDILEKIFDPFFTTKPVGEGTGLGLDIVRRIVNSHNGEIDVESRPGRTEFCVKLPLSGKE
jgi:signal transduction histidine kinase